MSRMVAALGARVIRGRGRVAPLLSGLTGVSQCLPNRRHAAGFRLLLPDSGLPLAFATRLETIPAATPICPLPRARVAGLGKPPRPSRHIAGRPRLVRQSETRQRSQPIDPAALAGAHPGCRRDIRQSAKGSAARRQDDALEQAEIIDQTADLTDFAETAALASCLDLVITVDTSVAHLTGALGRPTWILLPYTPDYRWLLDRDDSPWYPTVRLFRQDARRDYARWSTRVRSELVAMICRRESGLD